jgi:amino acid adenylation domain-containing protein
MMYAPLQAHSVPAVTPTILQCVQAQASQRPDAPAFVAPGRLTLSYAALVAQVEALIERLQRLGVQRQDRIAIVLPDGPEMATAFLAVSACATVAPLNPLYRTAEIEAAFANIRPAALLTQTGMNMPALQVARAHDIPVFEITVLPDTPAGVFQFAGEPVRPFRSRELTVPGDVLLLLNTSGTTSLPKLVPITQRNICSYIPASNAMLSLSPADRGFHFLPLYNSHGIIFCLLSPLLSGGACLFLPAFDPSRFFEWMEELRPTYYSCVPTMHQAILEAAPRHRDIIARSALRFLRSSSATLPPQIIAKLEETFQVPLIEAYGLTETGGAVVCSPLPPRKRKIGSVGLPLGVDLAILDQAGNVLPAEKVGEIALRGERVLSAYGDGTPVPRTNGWLRSGDIGHLDSEGYLYITGRVKEIINRGGTKIFPREVEEALLGHPAVAQAVVFALPDARLGEVVGAAVVLRAEQTADAETLRRFLAERLVPHKIPRTLLFLDALPTSDIGKLIRVGLAERLGLTSDDAGASEDLSSAPTASPQSPLEERLAAIYRETLGLEQVSTMEGFFHLGGDSLRAMQALARIRETLATDVTFIEFFTAATIVGVAALIETKLRLRQGNDAQEARKLPEIAGPLCEGDGPFPLSFGQQRIWFMEQLEPDTAAHHIARALDLEGDMNLPALRQAFDALLERHAALRTGYVLSEGELQQRIFPPSGVPFSFHDLRARTLPEREAALQALIAAEIGAPFALTSGSGSPMLRIMLARSAKREHTLLLVLHHIAADGWSVGVLLREWAALYTAAVKQEARLLPALPLRYADYACRQRDARQEADFAAPLAYWTDRLTPLPPPLSLPTGHARPAQPSYRGFRETFTLSAELSQDLKAFSRREGVTLYMTLLAAFQVLLLRYTEQTDFCIGSPVAGRTQVALEGLVGCFINTLVLRADLSGDPSFRALLHGVRAATLSAYAHQEFPFERLVEALQPERDPSRHPLFQAMFILQNTPSAAVELPDLTVAPREVHTQTSLFDLTLTVHEHPTALRMQIEASAGLFEPETMRRMLGHLHTLLTGLLARPEAPLSALPLLPESERATLLEEWNNTQTPPVEDLLDLFAAQAAHTPDAIALVGESEACTYRQLSTRVEGLAARLRTQGVCAETGVALYLDRSLLLPVALLAVLRAGGAFLPLDPSHPPARLEAILEDAQPALLLTERALLACLPHTTATVLCLDAEREEEYPLETVLPRRQSAAEQARSLAYTLFTSGSTGRPKGVLIERGALSNLLVDMAARIGITARDTLVAVTTISFDIALLEMFAPLLVGARVVVASRETASDGRLLAQLLRTSGATLMQATPATWQMLLDADWQPAAAAGFTILCGGDTLTQPLADRLTRTGATLWNLYGPTETTIWSTACRLAAGDPVTLGRPLSNTRCYLLDAQGEPTPIGVPGELAIGGVGVARGYLGLPERNAARFGLDPFHSGSESRIYRTGDLCRFLPDGRLEHLGRRDHQVKIRGYRIELAEITLALMQHPAVREAVTTVREESGEKRLVAYLVPVETLPTAEEWRLYLKARLPEYMIPTAFVALAALPLTPNGKIDRAALPPAERERPAVEDPALARDPLIRQLTPLWEETLQVHSIGPHDNFFDLGGHSLAAVRLFARIELETGHKLPLALLFQAPTVAEQAHYLRERASAASWSVLVPIRSQGSRPPLYCVHALGGNVLTYRALAYALEDEQPIYGLQSPQAIGEALPFYSVEEMAAHYLAEVRRLQPTGPYHLCGMSYGGIVAFEMARQLQAVGEKTGLLAIFDAEAPGYRPPARLQRLAGHARYLRSLGRADKRKYIMDHVHKLSASRLRKKFNSKASSPAPDKADRAASSTIEEVERLHRRTWQSYHPPQSDYFGSLLLFRAGRRPAFYFDPQTVGWENYVTGPLEIRVVVGSHTSIMEAPHVQDLARELQNALHKAGGHA